ERPDNSGASGAVAAEIALDVIVGDRLALWAEGDRDCALDLAHEGMAPLDAAVEDAHAHTGAGRALDRPFPVDLLRQRVGERDLGGCLTRQRPGWEKLLFAHFPLRRRAGRRLRSLMSSVEPTLMRPPRPGGRGGRARRPR